VSHFEVKNTSCCNFVNEKSTTIFGRFEKASIFEFPKKEKNIPLSIFKMQAMNEKKKRKTKRGLKIKKFLLSMCFK